MTMTLEGIKGRIGDLDSHESIPTPRYAEVFGEIGRRFSEENAELWRLGSAASIEDPENQITVDYEDTLEITQETVWTKKGVRAPGATNMDRRTAVMDEMGIQRQLIFPMMGILAWFQAQGGGQIWMPPQTKEQMELGKAAVNAYNDWAGRLTKKYSDRMWVVGILRSGDADMTLELMIKEAERLIASGCRAIMMSAGSPPAGLSPGDRKLDPFYELVAKANVSLVFHPPSGLNFRKSDIWEYTVLDPVWWGVTVQHVAEENFLAIMVLSGVFDRHPNLRLGFVETGADWIGPLAERMDRVVVSEFKTARVGKLSLKPSETLSRNVRVSVMADEPIETWLQRYPQIQDVYCYSSDFPHIEGGQWSAKRLFERLAPMGNDILEKFFIKNSQLVLPTRLA